jgi:hypothetical protein
VIIINGAIDFLADFAPFALSASGLQSKPHGSGNTVIEAIMRAFGTTIDRSAL